jgi:type VI secretion system protein ImpF
MSDENSGSSILLSVLDRLLDDDPERPAELPLRGPALHRVAREAIRRDVEQFFNTRRRCVPMPEEYSELKDSLLDYGVPDLVGRNLANHKRRQLFLRELESFLRNHDRRFKSIKISPVGSVNNPERMLHFRIDAVLHAEPAPETMVFDSRIEPVSKTFEIKG